MKKIAELEQFPSHILKRIETIDKRHDETLRDIKYGKKVRKANDLD